MLLFSYPHSEFGDYFSVQTYPADKYIQGMYYGEILCI